MDPKFGIVFKVEQVCIPKRGTGQMSLNVLMEHKAYTALEMQQAIKAHDISTILTHGERNALGSSGVHDAGDDFVFQRMSFASIYGRPAGEQLSQELAFDLGLASVDSVRVASLLNKINKGLDSQLERISTLASIIAPMMIMQGPLAATIVGGVEASSFTNPVHATLFRHYTENWMTALLIEQGLDPALGQSAMDRLHTQFETHDTSRTSPTLR